MTSGEWITYVTIALAIGFALWQFVIFPAWELWQLQRKRSGNKSARTMSQFVMKRAEGGSKFWQRFLIWFPAFVLVFGVALTLVGAWLWFHWEAIKV